MNKFKKFGLFATIISFFCLMGVESKYFDLESFKGCEGDRCKMETEEQDVSRIKREVEDSLEFGAIYSLIARIINFLMALKSLVFLIVCSKINVPINQLETVSNFEESLSTQKNEKSNGISIKSYIDEVFDTSSYASGSGSGSGPGSESSRRLSWGSDFDIEESETPRFRKNWKIW